LIWTSQLKKNILKIEYQDDTIWEIEYESDKKEELKEGESDKIYAKEELIKLEKFMHHKEKVLNIEKSELV